MPPDRRAPQPSRTPFDPYNSSSIGHQRAENKVGRSTEWRESRSAKLAVQLRSGAGGGRRMADTAGAGVQPAERRRGWRSVAEMLQGKTVKPSTADSRVLEKAKPGDEETKKLFAGLGFYVNGSTAPAVSDHRLKQLIAEHGGAVHIGLARQRVSHVVLGSAGGSLAAVKIQREILRVRGCGVKYVGVDWVLQSVKAGVRLPEAAFSVPGLVPQGQRSVYGLLRGSARERSDEKMGTERSLGNVERVHGTHT
ncbi:MAG: hypothetical protein M1832_004436 [Thelocarpon impressellum]|nr:MAG: hypothetical protein M1832_004436 [Thelocarpon impressellum]